MLECIVVEDTDDVTLEAGDTVKLIRILSPDKYLVQTVGESGTTVEGTVSAEFLRAIGEEKKLEGELISECDQVRLPTCLSGSV